MAMIYVYRCRRCGFDRDLWLDLAHRVPRCPVHSLLMHRVYTPPNIRAIGKDSGSPAGSPLGNNHTDSRDELDRQVRSGEIGYDEDEVVF